MATTGTTTSIQAQLLLEPPRLYCHDTITAHQVPATTQLSLPVEGAIAMDKEDDMVDATNHIADPQMGWTRNCSPTFFSTGNPCLDFFFHILPDTPKDSLKKRLKLAWIHNPLTTLKLICHLRDVRGTGKSDKEGFYVAALWLHQNHPKTLALNVRWFAEFGYFKDLLEILYRILEGANVRKVEEEKRKDSVLYWTRGKRNERKQNVLVKKRGRSEYVQKNMAKKALLKYTNDPNYRFLHDRISDVFAELLSLDVESLKSKQYKKISLASKWCPSLDSSYDRSTLICESIAKKVFPRDSDPEYEGIEESHYAYRVRDRLRKQVLVPLHQALQLPEIYMSAKKWNSLPYQRVASVAMKLYKQHFVEHDKERFSNHLKDVRLGKTKIAAGALLPHEILESLFGGTEAREVAELQWRRMVEDLSVKGTLKNCMAICDVSGSMCGLPMQVCVALGLLVSQLSSGPWKNKLITFSRNPTLQIIKGDTLEQKKSFVESMEWGMNTNFQKVFDLILDVAVKGKLRKSRMIKRLFVFSDMEFGKASANNWETDYQAIQKKFTENGYGSVIPEIVFWNLRDSRAIPVAATQNGVALVSGYSKNLLKLFLEGEDSISPEAIMESSISGAEYKNLHVFD
ncbi:hypothetical protein AQUCO_00100380v1 [Aquilegia coerulea]|uniref:TROVE domain-containing protein n=1 Tax=Aquilegia coerulea TaxID=218851 RepID=A0A2G5FAA0_AQUCA|nr:hypothetical protein AQUCO_00100380v1 [Aquilegia coerulea]